MQSWVNGETLPRTFTLYADEDSVQNLTGSTVELILVSSGGVVLDTSGDVAVTDAVNGVVTYTPDSTHIQTSLSPLSALFRVTNGIGQIGYFPGDGAEEWHVHPTTTAFPRLTFADLRKQVLRWLDQFVEFDTGSDIDELVKQQINEANTDRSTEHTWPFMRTEMALPVTGGVRDYTLPGNLARLLYLWSPADRKFLTLVPHRHLDEAGLSFDGTTQSTLYQPFEIRGPVLHFFEGPRQAESLRVGYYKTPSKMINATDLPNVPFPHSRVLVWDALLDLKSYANELSAISLWARKQEAAVAKLYGAYVDGGTLGGMPLSIKRGQGNF